MLYEASELAGFHPVGGKASPPPPPPQKERERERKKEREKGKGEREKGERVFFDATIYTQPLRLAR